MDTLKEILVSGDAKNIDEILKFYQSRDKDEYINMLGDIIAFISKRKLKSPVIKKVLEAWDYVNHDPDTSFLAAVEYFVCPEEDLRYIVNELEDLSDVKYMLGQIIDSKSFGQIVKRLLYAYNITLNNDDLVDLKEFIDNHEDMTGRKCESAYAYISMNMKKESSKPDWVSLAEYENKTLLNKVSLGESFKGDQVFFEDFKDIAKKYLSNVKDIDSMLNVFVSSITDTAHIDQSYNLSFRVWGPENRFQDRECGSNPNSEGPCRMLQCLCREEEHEADWFKGYCDSCNKKIKDKSHSLRYPIRDGGWSGCYCCFTCITENPPVQMNTEDNVRLKLMKERIYSIGIMDRSL